MAQDYDTLASLVARLRVPGVHSEIKKSGKSLLLQRGGMQIVVRPLKTGEFEVLYEHAPHETTRERCEIGHAEALIGALLRRKHLGKVELPGKS
jgi:hypothetical protein